MSHEPLHSTDAEIDALEAMCTRLEGFGCALSVEIVDGWLTALACTARRVPRDEWLPLLTEDNFDRAYADPADAAPALAALDARLRVLASQLDPQALFDEPDALRLNPLMTAWDDAMRADAVARGLEPENAENWLRTGFLWADGFRAAMQALAADWPEPDLDTADGAALDDLLAPLDALQLPPDELDDYLAEVYPGETLDRDDLVDEACFAVQELRLYWLDRATRPAPRRVEPRPGRNDPCPCGSGKKFKKCHGAT